MVKKNRQKKKKDLLDITSKRELAIALLIGGGVITVAALSPALLAAAIPSAMVLKEGDTKKKRKIQKVLNTMEREGAIKVKRRAEKAEVVLTKKGEKTATTHYIRQKLEQAKERRSKSWDGKWRIVIFDIPSRQRIVRDALRYLIKKLGMYQLQKSVWVYPHDCSKEIEEIKSFFGIPDDSLRFIVTDSIGPDKKIRKNFNI